MIILQDNITSVIPQRPPFVMIDGLVSCNETSSITTFRVKAENLLVRNGKLSEAGITENIAQTAQYVSSGNAELGLISLTSALALRNSGSYVPIPSEDYPRILQGAIVVVDRSCTGAMTSRARKPGFSTSPRSKPWPRALSHAPGTSRSPRTRPCVSRAGASSSRSPSAPACSVRKTHISPA